jgi:hypothetical protein
MLLPDKLIVLMAQEAPGFLYAYELRDLQNPASSFFKVGRTDNVPRRIGEWTTRKSPMPPGPLTD